MESPPELSVVCRSCGSEVSPYVTECPYCGTRLRKRAPKLERRGDELTPRETRRDRRRRRAAERREARSWSFEDRPYVTIAVILAAAIVLVVERASDLTVEDLGAIIGTVGGEAWRYVAAPFVSDDTGYLFATGLALAIFLPGIERRLGMVPAALLVLASGALGALAAEGIESSIGDEIAVVGGGNGIALGALGAWVALRESERRVDPTQEYDRFAVAVAAAVLLALPLVEDLASAVAGVAGGLVGLACGFAASRGRR